MKTITLFDKVEKAATSLYLCALESSAQSDSIFRMLMNVDFDGSIKPLLVAGRAFKLRDEGHLIAVLNPDKNLLNKIIPGCRYGNLILKEIVQGKCDLSLALWIKTNIGLNVSRSTQYKSRKPSPVRFSPMDSAGS